jgi:hypothetical protein
MKISLYSLANHGRAGNIAQALAEGFRRHGIEAAVHTRWRGAPAGDMAIAYGWKHEPVFNAYKAAGRRFAYFDMGYFNRRPGRDKGGSREGHHRLAVDGWDTAETMVRGCPSDRWDDLEIEVLPDRAGIAVGAVLIAGMSDKAAGTHGFKPGQWEADTLARVRAAGASNIIMRAKPANLDSVEPIASVLARTSLVITHHSNVAVDGLVSGVPCYARKGVGKLVSRPDFISPEGDLTWLPSPPLAERRALLADVAYAQWTPDEMRSGAAWDHIRRIIG